MLFRSASNPQSVVTFPLPLRLSDVGVCADQLWVVSEGENRVIRLEERLRFQSVLPKDVAEKASHLPVSQLVAMRFAPDEELPELVESVLSGRLTDPKAIKQAVRDWRADHLRA